VRFLSWIRFLLLFIPLSGIPAWAFDWPDIAPQDLSMTSVPEQPGASAVVLLREETDDDMNNTHSVYMRIKILTDAGREYANVEIPYNRRGFHVSDISGRTIHADGTIIPFTGTPFDKTVLKGSGFRVNEKSFTLPDVQVGSIIDYRYSLRYEDNLLLPPTWEVQTDLFQRQAYFKFIPFQNHGNMYIQLAHGQIAQGIAWVPFIGNGVYPKLHTLPNTSYATVHQVTEWVDMTETNVPPLVNEPFMAPPSLLRWRVYFYYQENLTADPYWKSEGKYWSKDVSHFMDHDKGIRDEVAKITSSSDTPEEKVKKIYAFIDTLQNRDYLPQKTKQEKAVLEIKVNTGVEDVLTNQSGSHDELNRLFVAMVKAAGIPATLMWVPDRSEDLFIKQYLSTSQLDAEIAVVELDGKDVFLDPGSKFCPYGDLDWRYTGIAGLRDEGNGATFAVTPGPTFQQAILTRMARVSLDQHGQLSGMVGLTFMGLQAMTRRQEALKMDDEGRKTMLEDELRSMLPGNSQVTLVNSPDWDGTETPLIAQFHIECPFAIAAGKHLMLMQHLFQVNETERFAAAQRTNAVYFHYPWQEADVVYISIPAGMQIESLAPDDTVRLKYALYQVQQKQDSPTELYSRRDFVMGDMVIVPQDYKELKDFFDKVKADDSQPALVRFSQSATISN
jgi:Domain of Unknown Function with PDB structure (DUF3857)/Transglutaminase-like superfamily